jgi:thiamine kinase
LIPVILPLSKGTKAVYVGVRRQRNARCAQRSNSRITKMQPLGIDKHEAGTTGPPPGSLVRTLSAAMRLSPLAIWSPMAGGRTNRVWHLHDPDLDTPSGPWIVKLYTADAATPLFRNDPQAELAILHAVSCHELAPDPVMSAQTVDGDFLVYRYVEGEPWQEGAENAARTLRVLHATEDPPVMPLAPDGSAALVAQTLGILDAIKDPRGDDLRGLQPRQQVPPSGVRHLLHGDPVPGNLICPTGAGSRNPVLIDWQCPVLGDPVLDLAMFLSPAMQQIARGKPLSTAEIQQFLTAYADPDAVDRLRRLQAFLHWRMAAYCLWKLTRPMPDAAYAKGLALERAALVALG